MKSPRLFLISDFLLKFAGILTSVAVAVATLGIPVPISLVKDIRQWFPCMSCGCGCVDAETCWRQCCCYTNAQKLAWADQHGIKVPDYLSDQVDVETAQVEGDVPSSTKPCCLKRMSAARGVSDCKNNPVGSDPADETLRPAGVLAIQALKCQGNSLSLSLLPPSVPTEEIGAQLELAPTDSLTPVESHFYQPPFFDAVVPPPERAAC